MKFPNQGENPWAWWQPLRLRMEARKYMKPLTQDQANTRRLVVAALYLITAAAFFHTYAFRLGAGSSTINTEKKEVALKYLNRGKLVEMENFRIKKVMDYKSEDFDSKIERTNKPSTILD